KQITRVARLPAILVARQSTEPGLIDSVTWIGITEERPDWRGTLTGQYSVSRFHALARASYFGKFSSAQPGYCDRCRDSYGGKTLVDAGLGYRFNRLELSVGARQLLHTTPSHAQ